MSTIVINSLWIGDRVGEMERLAMRSHISFGHEYHLWTYSPIAVPEGVIVEDGNEILSESEIFSYHVGVEAGSVSAFSNLFRYKLLFERGGWWCDSDVVCLKRFDFDEPYVFASERYKTGSCGPTTCVILTPRKSELMSHCWKKASEVDRRTLRWGTIGPLLLMEGVFSHRLDQYVRPVSDFCPVDWFDIKPLFTSNALPDSYAIHLWNEVWRREGIDKERSYEGSLYATLKEKFL